MASGKVQADIRLGTPLVMVFKLGVPFLEVLLICGIAYTLVEDIRIEGIFDVIGLLWVLFVCFFLFVFGKRYAGLTVIHLRGDQLHVSRWYQVDVFPVSDLREVCVEIGRGFPEAMFSVSSGSGAEELIFRTLLRPRLTGWSTECPSDLSALDGVLVRVRRCWGKDRLFIDGQEVNQRGHEISEE